MEELIKEHSIYRLSKLLVTRMMTRSVMEFSAELEDCILVEAAAALGVPRYELDELPPQIIQAKEGMIHMYHVVLEGLLYNMNQQVFNDPNWWNRVNTVRGRAPGGGALGGVTAQMFMEHYRPKGGESWADMATRLDLLERYIPAPGLDSTPAAKRRAVAIEAGAGAGAGSGGASMHDVLPGTPQSLITRIQAGGPGQAQLDFAFPSALRPWTLDEYSRLNFLYGTKLAGASHNLRTRTGLSADALLPAINIVNPSLAAGTGGVGLGASGLASSQASASLAMSTLSVSQGQSQSGAGAGASSLASSAYGGASGYASGVGYPSSAPSRPQTDGGVGQATAGAGHMPASQSAGHFSYGSAAPAPSSAPGTDGDTSLTAPGPGLSMDDLFEDQGGQEQGQSGHGLDQAEGGGDGGAGIYGADGSATQSQQQNVFGGADEDEDEDEDIDLGGGFA